MKCTECGSKCMVLETRTRKDGTVRRSYRCLKDSGHKFFSLEQVQFSLNPSDQYVRSILAFMNERIRQGQSEGKWNTVFSRKSRLALTSFLRKNDCLKDKSEGQPVRVIRRV